MDVKQISDLIDILSRSDVSTLKYEEESFKLTLMKEKPAPQTVAVAQPAVQAVVQTPAPLPEVAGPPAAAEPSEPPAEDLAEMATPFVGTFYAAPSPDAEPFVEVGRRVNKGQVICIVEAMKVMNEIESEIDGEVVEILVANGQPVEYGEVLFLSPTMPTRGLSMFRKILIANRGEIALRIIWACRELGIKTVAVHSTADADPCTSGSPTRRSASGRPRNDESYLNVSAVIAAAEITDAEAIHPGYGFLAESAHFAEVCRECGLTFIGPGPGGDPAHGGQGRGAADDDRGRRAHRPGQRGRGRGRRTRPLELAERDRLSGADQGLGRRRRPGHADRPEPPRILERQFDAAAQRGRRRLRQSRSSTSRSTSSSRGTSSSRSWETPTATWCTCSSGSARSSAGTRSCWRSALPPPWTTICAARMAEHGAAGRRGRWTTSTRARSSSCSTPAASSTSSR